VYEVTALPGAVTDIKRLAGSYVYVVVWLFASVRPVTLPTASYAQVV
jgi:hypothetical protein